jgi:hypothetical protein
MTYGKIDVVQDVGNAPSFKLLTDFMFPGERVFVEAGQVSEGKKEVFDVCRS